ncbi:MAG: hypothetical protein WA815_16105 [Terracidiphilus sp.]
MTLLREIQAAATDPSVDISTLLRKAKILAARLRNPEFAAWVDHELNGYEDRAAVPSYRVLFSGARATLTDGFRIWNDFQVMTTFLPEKYRDWGEKCYLNEPIAAIASMAKRDSLAVPWPQELAVQYGAKGTNGLHCLKAWLPINPDSLLGVLDTVRSRLLDFALKLEAENPDVGEVQAGLEPIPPERLRPLVVNTFYGPVGSVAQHSEKFTQSANIGSELGDLARFVEEFSAHLRELGLDERQELRARAQIDVIQTELGGKPDEDIILQSGRTLRNITEGAIGGLLATAVQPTVWQWIHQMLLNFR